MCVLWLDKYRPQTIKDLDYQKESFERLGDLVSGNDFPHMLFYGPPGAGKKTRIFSLLNKVFGHSVDKLWVERRKVKEGSEQSIAIISSPYHIELNPSDAGRNDRLVVSEIIKEMASYAAVNREIEAEGEKSSGLHAHFSAAKKKSSKHSKDEEDDEDTKPSHSAPRFKVIVLNDADMLSRGAQQALRRTMELYVRSCRLILVAETPSKIIEPLKSRCLCVRVPAPTDEQVFDLLKDVYDQENESSRLYDMSDSDILTITKMCKGNLRRGILTLQATCAQRTHLRKKTMPEEAEWRLLIHQIAQRIIDKQDGQALLSARTDCYDLLTSCIPTDIIFEELTMTFLQKLPDSVHSFITFYAALYEMRAVKGTKAIYHIEAFLATVQRIIVVNLKRK
ncbi:replication factor c subunit 3 [Aduncisulcus paluster]|uniref:Replication factor c subunit 3 n=1 Tax=Aduncisulcus paluster TaxID=2918883 RepID=A0ABQ5KGJ6_9EUKA|nr:replication factor c subunit 3 [Aduncisulcus paluster]